MSIGTARRYYQAKAYQAGVAGDNELRSAWLAKQAAEPGTALAATIPHQADLAALVPPYTALEDLTGSSVDELVTVGLVRSKARAVMDAVGG